MASDLLGVSVSGLRVAQTALSTTGHNISNADVKGYSRQVANAATNPATFQGGNYIGTGASIESIERVANEFVIEQQRKDTSLYNELNTYNALVGQLDNLLSDQNTGLSGALDSFFASVQNGTDDPTSIPARQLIISEADNLSARFNNIYERFDSLGGNVDDSLETAVSRVNAIVDGLANINARIGDAVGQGNGSQPNDLLDQRDEALRELSSLVSIQTFEQSNGEVNVLIGNGQSVVVGRESRNISLQENNDDPTKQDIVFSSNGNQQVLTNLLSGGEIGGLLRFRETGVGESFNQFGALAVAVVDAFNEVHNQGITLDNNFGQDFFRDINDPISARSRVIGASTNVIAPGQDRVLSLNITDSASITGSDYNVAIEGGGLYRITRASDDAQVATGLIPGNTPFTAEFDGLELVFESGAFQAGDEFTLQPVRFAARDIRSDIIDPRAIAFGAPLVTDASLGNEGTGQISSGQVLSLVGQNGVALPTLAQAGELDPPVVIRFTSQNTYDVLDNSDPGNPQQLDPPIRNQQYVPGIENSIFPTDPGETLIAADGELLGIPSGKNAIVGAGQVLNNGYPAEAISFSLPNPNPSGDDILQTVFTPINASAKEIANVLSNVPGVSVNAFNYIEVSNLQVTDQTPLQLSLNGQPLLDYDPDPITGLQVLGSAVPNGVSDPVLFNDYVAERINNDQDFSSLGIYAVSGKDAITGNPELKIYSTQGDDLQIDLVAGAGQTLSVSDGFNDDSVLTGQGSGITSAMVAGGRFDITMADGITMQTFPPQSTLFGDSSAPDFAKNRFLGIQASIVGEPKPGDDFSIDFNNDGASDNRNALVLGELQSRGILGGGKLSISDGYGALVERVGIDTAASRINVDAAEQVLEQTTATRDSISAVNLDEEAANLIKFEQMYQANAQVISVARSLFDTLIGSF